MEFRARIYKLFYMINVRLANYIGDLKFVLSFKSKKFLYIILKTIWTTIFIIPFLLSNFIGIILTLTMYLFVIDLLIPFGQVITLGYALVVDVYNLIIPSIFFYLVIIPDIKYLKGAILASDNRELRVMMLAEKLRRDDIMAVEEEMKKEAEAEVAYYNYIMNDDNFK